MGEKRFTKLKITAKFPHCCDECYGKLYYLGAGAFECRSCNKTIYSDYGKVRKYIEENGMTSIPILEKMTGVDRETLEEFERDGTLYDPFEDIEKCHGCGCVIEKGRYCKECQENIIGRLADALKPEETETDPETGETRVIKKKTNRMHYLKND